MISLNKYLQRPYLLIHSHWRWGASMMNCRVRGGRYTSIAPLTVLTGLSPLALSQQSTNSKHWFSQQWGPTIKIQLPVTIRILVPALCLACIPTPCSSLNERREDRSSWVGIHAKRLWKQKSRPQAFILYIMVLKDTCPELWPEEKSQRAQIPASSLHFL